MPNNLGGDQHDPEYKGEDVADEERKVPRRRTSETGLPMILDDYEPYPRQQVSGNNKIGGCVRLAAGDYRVVVPDGTQKGSRFFVNNSPVVVEKRGLDATKQAKWDHVATFNKPGANATDVERALYWLLAGPGAE